MVSLTDPRRAAETTSGARQSSLRASNLSLVARTVCASPEPISRAGVAKRTSMTRSTASRLADDLVAAGLHDELERAGTTGPGRPATPLVAGGGVAALGLQVNAGFLAARVVSLRGDVIGEHIEVDDLVGSPPVPTLERLAAIARDVLDGMPSGVRLVGGGLALPGVVSTDTGTLLLAPNLGWADLRPVEHLPGDLLPAGAGVLRVGNEADLAARTVAEETPGRPGPVRDFVYLSGEIGIGGAVVLDGRVMTGQHGWAGEIGHVTVDPDGPACPCGSTGCLERYAGRHAILDAAGMDRDSTAADIATAAASGDARATEALGRAARALGIAVAGVLNVLDIPAVVLGGHLGQIADLLRPELERQLRTRVMSARWAAPTIVPAPVDLAPGATGAAMLELSLVLDQPALWADHRTSQGASTLR